MCITEDEDTWVLASCGYFLQTGMWRNSLRRMWNATCVLRRSDWFLHLHPVEPKVVQLYCRKPVRTVTRYALPSRRGRDFPVIEWNRFIDLFDSDRRKEVTWDSGTVWLCGSSPIVLGLPEIFFPSQNRKPGLASSNALHKNVDENQCPFLPRFLSVTYTQVCLQLIKPEWMEDTHKLLPS